MRRALFSPAIVFLALTAGCRSVPPSAPNPTPGPNGVAQSQKTKLDLAMESIKRRGGAVQIDQEDLQKSVVVADLHGFNNAGAALDSLAPLTKLREVNLHATGFTDADLERLRGLTNLQNLNLSGTKITD
ncbi:MAG TPA: hypothetical protein VE999_17155, partial [Gemmataceae bacterium]|nr:hypothetical protein [Gemmataceae bacterium]